VTRTHKSTLLRFIYSKRHAAKDTLRISSLATLETVMFRRKIGYLFKYYFKSTMCRSDGVFDALF